MANEVRHHWTLDPDVTYLNHGAFGACPKPVLRAQDEWRARMERHPIRFHDVELEGHLATARERLGEFLHAEASDLAFLPNATMGVNTVLASLEFQPGDEILGTDHEYNACLNAARRVAAKQGANVIVAELPFPTTSPDEMADALLARVTPDTRLVLISQITSPTGIRLPIERLVPELAQRGIDTLVDGAHAPGMLALDIEKLGAAYYTGNCHKWLCAPKGAGFLHVRRDRQALIHPLVTSHGANSSRTDQSLFRLEFDWTGTADPTAYLSIPAALDFMGGLLPGGFPEVMRRNHELVLAGRQKLLDAVGGQPLAPAEMLGSLAAIDLPDAVTPSPRQVAADAERTATYPHDPLRDALSDEDLVEVPVFAWPHTPSDSAPRRRLLRISAQLYNEPADYDRLASVLAARLR
ncbi:MAG TPA: aminotransferase class V-fold PLP-dependent enzyme [Candidatus Limnocylindria bacterium]|nr:aminotransferase class V-fold PLP-dependent enzyme [Candidatus Limnocylindria bacterium]